MGAIARFFEPFYRRRLVSLVRQRGPESAHQQEIEREAAADVATVEQDDKYFSPDAPADQDELLSPMRSGAKPEPVRKPPEHLPACRTSRRGPPGAQKSSPQLIRDRTTGHRAVPLSVSSYSR